MSYSKALLIASISLALAYPAFAEAPSPPTGRVAHHFRKDVSQDNKDMRQDRRDLRSDVKDKNFKDARVDRRDIRKDKLDKHQDRRELKRKFFHHKKHEAGKGLETQKPEPTQ